MSEAAKFSGNSKTVARILARIEAARKTHQTNKVLYAYPSPFQWRERHIPVADVLRENRSAEESVRKNLNLYVGTPYCLPTRPERCGYCIFPSEVFSNKQQLKTYLDYLKKEVALYRPLLGERKIGSVYIGGGTANLFLPFQYVHLMDIVLTLAGRLPKETEITLEGVPHLFTRARLEAMKDAGINRLSIGVQQFDPDLIKLSGRRQSADQTFRTIEWCREKGLGCSIDLIFGWPTQTVENMLSDLETAVRTGVPHITHYEMNIGGRTDFALNRRSDLPTPDQKLGMYRESKSFLESHGYRQVTTYDWKLSDPLQWPCDFRYEETMLSPLSSDCQRIMSTDLLGIGYAGINFFIGTPEQPGWAYRHQTQLTAYYDNLDRGEFPVERGYRFNRHDLEMNILFRQLLSMVVDRRGYERTFGVDPVETHKVVWRALEELGWVSITDETVTLIGDGVFYTPLIQSLLARDIQSPGQ